MNYTDVLVRLDGRTSRKIGNDAYLLASYRGEVLVNVHLRFHGVNVFTWWNDGRVDCGRMRINPRISRVITEQTTNNQTSLSTEDN